MARSADQLMQWAMLAIPALRTRVDVTRAAVARSKNMLEGDAAGVSGSGSAAGISHPQS
jgi:hypothetical protein